MNKAFVREPDDNGERHCPRCGSLGIAVQHETLVAQLCADALAELGQTAHFCPFAKCEVAYFDAFERVVLVAGFKQPVYPKDPDAPLCPCFGLTADDIAADLAEGTPTRVRAHIAKAKTDAAHCATCSPTGQSCVPHVQQYYLRELTARKTS
jgi:hypothetical protein